MRSTPCFVVLFAPKAILVSRNLPYLQIKSIRKYFPTDKHTSLYYSIDDYFITLTSSVNPTSSVRLWLNKLVSLATVFIDTTSYGQKTFGQVSLAESHLFN